MTTGTTTAAAPITPPPKTDQELQREVLLALRWNPLVEATRVAASVDGGIVTLQGRVESYRAMRAAEEAARRVAGVRGVVNELVVRPDDDGEVIDDADIAEAAVHALKWNIFVPSSKIQVSVSDGQITLEGEVRWQFQRLAAEDAVRNLDGVTRVINNIRIKSHATADNLKAGITEALKRQAILDAQRITVESVGDRIILLGTVRSWAERSEAERVAWSAPGVREVENLITVEEPR
ncbi:MAG: osmY [Mycobacterium sp.]|nr:osmY [Mycobacterium sp.]